MMTGAGIGTAERKDGSALAATDSSTAPNTEKVSANTTLGQAIRWLRERKGWSARALSAEANLSPSYVGKLENGEIEPSFKIFARLAVVLDMTPQEVAMLIAIEVV